MNYHKIYTTLIYRAKNRTILHGNYVEKHHILPKSLYPEYTKTKWNIVKLFPEEHLIAHLLLAKIYNNKEIIHAAHRMTNNSKVNNKKYKWIREKHAKIISEAFTGRAPWNKGKVGVQDSPMKGKSQSLKSKNKISLTKTGVSFKTKLCIYCNKAIGINNYNRYHNDNCKYKEGNEKLHVKKVSTETREKISKGVKNTVRVLSTFICPHCGKSGKGPNMTRYHFDNCKLKAQQPQ